MFVVERPEFGIRRFQKNIQAALRQSQIEIGNFVEYITHRHIERAPFFERQAAKIIEKVRFKLQSILVGLLQELFAAETERVTRLPGDIFEEPLKALRVLLLFFE